LTPSLLTAGQVAELLGVPTSWVYEQSRLGRIPTVMLGRYRRYRRAALEGWILRIEGASLSQRHRLVGAGDHHSPGVSTGDEA